MAMDDFAHSFEVANQCGQCITYLSCIREYIHLEFVLILFLEVLFHQVPIRPHKYVNQKLVQQLSYIRLFEK